MAKAKNARASREPTLREEIAASGETPTETREEGLDELGYLAREFLTWLVYHADVDGGAFPGAGDVGAFRVQFGGRLALRTGSGFVTDMTVKGSSPGISPDLRYALAGGLCVKEAELRLALGDGSGTGDRREQLGRGGPAGSARRGEGLGSPSLEEDERAYTFALAAEGFDLKRVKLPALLTEEEDDRADERLTLLAELDAALEHAYAQFLVLRTRPTWKKKTVPAMQSWLRDGT